MIQPSEIKIKAERLYPKYLQRIAADQPFERIVLPCDKKPNKDFELYRKEYDALHQASKASCGYGYSVTWRNVDHRTLGSQAVPLEIAFDTESDFLKYLRKEKEVSAFRKDQHLILAAFPSLSEWLTQYPKKVVKYAGQWQDLLKVLVYFNENPQPHLYIRELPIEVHTKFIERHKGILRELLDLIIADYVDTSERDFEPHFHLKYDEALIRIRFLDSRLTRSYGAGIEDISMTVSKFCALRWKVSNVFVVENKVNFLTFPPVPDALVIFGHGYGVSTLKTTPFLQQAQLYYWGDLDAQGFEILSQFRGYFPQARSFFMDLSTFRRFFENDTGQESYVKAQLLLTPAEQEVYDIVKENNWRLEQEKIPHSYVEEHLPTLLKKTGKLKIDEYSLY